MLIFIGVVLGVMVVAQVVALVYAQGLSSKGDSDVETAHRNAAINATVAMLFIALFAWPPTNPWYKLPGVRAIYLVVANNLKPGGLLPAQTYGDKKEAKAAQQMYSLIHKGLLAAILSGVCGVVGGALSKSFAGQISSGGSQKYVPPKGPRSPFTGRPY